MSDESQTAETSLESGEPTAAPAPETTPAEAAAPDPVKVLEAEVADLKEKLLRSLAEMENLRRRTEKEVRDARDYAITGFARDLLSVGDNLARAVEAVPAGDRQTADAVLKGLIDGVDLTGRDLIKTLEKHGVKKLEPLGLRFDPNVHQAMFEIPNAEAASGTVLQVLQDGYVIGERVLRPALVGVSKGGPRPAASLDKSV
ncbi:MAG: nucleotide exchange factor GrpE [Ancalomicrobiaceae bacterium]|nr:nucleotide exchange factor GrpE [Ancalomicrobiaceae bacterium]